MRPPALGRRAFRPRPMAYGAMGVRPRGSLCGGCISACLLILIIGVVVLVLFWREVNTTLRGVYPAWPFAVAIPILFVSAYRWQLPIDSDARDPVRILRNRLRALLRASVAVPVGGQTFRVYLFCHGIPYRCLAIRGHPLPICARCTGLLVGIAAGFLLPAAAYLGALAALGLASLLVIPLLIDGVTQAAGIRESTNPLRLVTGVVGGLGLVFGVQVLRFALVGY